MQTEPKMINCPRCDGTGIYSERHGVCFRCKGQRTVPAPKGFFGKTRRTPGSHVLRFQDGGGNWHGLEIGTEEQCLAAMARFTHQTMEVIAR